MTTENGIVFSTIQLTIHSLDAFDDPMRTEIGLYADRAESLSIEPEKAAQ